MGAGWNLQSLGVSHRVFRAILLSKTCMVLGHVSGKKIWRLLCLLGALAACGAYGGLIPESHCIATSVLSKG